MFHLISCVLVMDFLNADLCLQVYNRGYPWKIQLGGEETLQAFPAPSRGIEIISCPHQYSSSDKRVRFRIFRYFSR